MSARPGAGHLPGLLAGVIIGLCLGAVIYWFVADEQAVDEQAGDLIEERYWRAVEPERLEDASIRGMVEELRDRYDDRFSHYFNPRVYERFQESTSGRFTGVGLGVTEARDGLRVVEVYDGSPAKEAGLERGDVIVAVEGRSIAGQPAKIATARIKGRPGTEVELTVRGAAGAERDLSVERAEVRIPAVRGALRERDGEKIAYVELVNFTAGAHGELRSEVERLTRQGAGAIVLDLRGNGGGLIDEAVLTASVFVEEGVIVSTSGRSLADESFEAVGDALTERPMVVLIDGDTASAAEILAAALGDYGLATLVGTRSYGKGTVQEVIRLENGGALDLTVGEYVTSDDRSLAGTGIRPAIHSADDPDTRRDEALDRALAVAARKLR